MNKITIENDSFSLTVNDSCIAESLIYKPLAQECLETSERLPLFSVTEERPYNNEIKLAFPNKRTTFNANRIRQEGNRLIVGFELVKFEAVVEFKITQSYIYFELVDFLVDEEHFKGLDMSPPPVEEFRLLQLPIANRKKFGEWLNVSFDENVAINVLATCPHTIIDFEKRKDFKILSADALKGIKLKGCGAALIVCDTNMLLDSIESLEEDFDLPRGVESRRSSSVNTSLYWSGEIDPSTVDDVIKCALRGGFRMILIGHYSIFKEGRLYEYCGDYDYREEYPNGDDDLRLVLEKIKRAGLSAGFHFLHTHIGKSTKYVTPYADHRLNLTRYFTLSKDVSENDTVIYVEQDPEGCVMAEKCRIIKLGTELIHYEGYSTQYPYCFVGCKRGYWDTAVKSHTRGLIGGVLDVSEYGAVSVYIDQNTSLQDEIADKIAHIYDLGFEFIYMDGSEGTNPPFAFHIPNAQYRVYKKLGNKPLFAQGAAKAHFSWHMLSGGNAFDIFPTQVFKRSIARYPLEEAGRMANDFTRVNFGWWMFYKDTQPDIFEYGASKAAAWSCPVTVKFKLETVAQNARSSDILEVLRRWEDVRTSDWLTEEQKKELKDPDKEHILLINEDGKYELTEYEHVPNAVGSDEAVRVFVFSRKQKSYAVIWHTFDEGSIEFPNAFEDMEYLDELSAPPIKIEKNKDFAILPVSKRRYISTAASKQELIAALISSSVL